VNGTWSTRPFSTVSADPAGTSCHSPGNATSGSETTARASVPKCANRSWTGYSYRSDSMSAL
jgi:hypothetical protein